MYFRIKEILKEKGITGVELAKRIKNEQGNPVTPQYINGIVSERGSVSLDKLKEIADALGVTMAELFADYKEKDTSLVKCPACNEQLRLVKVDETTMKAELAK
ncbi:MAG: helix-turn-helix transcriptional regulator [Prevotella sp.]|nr:helix-turn-helix transcriptional regulator [Prevotella sp.]